MPINFKIEDSGPGALPVLTDAKVRNSYANGRVVGSSNNIGGLVGFNSLSSVRNTYATVDVSGANGVGGLVGRNNGFVGNSYAEGEVVAAGSSGAIVGVVVDGEVVGVFPSADAAAPDPGKLTGDSSGWAPAALPLAKPLLFFCDLNRDGYIAPHERNVNNYIWDFGGGKDYPTIRCADRNE